MFIFKKIILDTFFIDFTIFIDYFNYFNGMQEKVKMSLLKTSETKCIKMTMLGCEEVR